MAVFEALSPTVVAPSRSALETWRGAIAFPHKAERILPHVRLINSRPAPVPAGLPAGRPVRAFR